MKKHFTLSRSYFKLSVLGLHFGPLFQSNEFSMDFVPKSVLMKVNYKSRTVHELSSFWLWLSGAFVNRGKVQNESRNFLGDRARYPWYLVKISSKSVRNFTSYSQKSETFFTLQVDWLDQAEIGNGRPEQGYTMSDHHRSWGWRKG